MAFVKINLIEQQQRRALRLNQASVVVAVVCGTIIGLELLIAAFLYTTAAVRAGQRDTAVQEREKLEQTALELDKQTNPLYPGMTLSQQARAYQQQVEVARALIDNHKYFTLYLSEIAINTPSQVIYNSFTTDAQNRLVVVGSADSYGDVAKLADSFTKLSFAKSASIQEARLDEKKVGQGLAVTFTMAIELKSAAELKKLPSPNRPAGGLNFGASPRPSASPGPSPSPTITPGS